MKRKVENTTYIKDTSTGAIINSNENEYRNARARRSKMNMERNKIISLQNELSDMKKQMSELIQLVKGSNNGDH